MRHLVSILAEDRIGNAKGFHVSGLLRKKIILQQSKDVGIKKGDVVSCSFLNPSENVYFVRHGRWKKVETLEEKNRLNSEGEIKRIFYDTRNGDVLVTGVWNNIREFAGLEKINVLRAGLLNEDAPLMYVKSIFTEPSKIYEIFNDSRRKIVVADFGGRLPSALDKDYNIKLVIEILSGCYLREPLDREP